MWTLGAEARQLSFAAGGGNRISGDARARRDDDRADVGRGGQRGRGRGSCRGEGQIRIHRRGAPCPDVMRELKPILRALSGVPGGGATR